MCDTYTIKYIGHIDFVGETERSNYMKRNTLWAINKIADKKL